MILSIGWHTEKFDCTTAFAQTEVQEEVYIETLCGFRGADKLHNVLKIRKFLYGLKQAPNTLYKKWKVELFECDFIQSEIDKCLFMNGDLV